VADWTASAQWLKTGMGLACHSVARTCKNGVKTAVEWRENGVKMA